MEVKSLRLQMLAVLKPGALATSRGSSSEGSLRKKAASGLEPDISFPGSKTPSLSKYHIAPEAKRTSFRDFQPQVKKELNNLWQL